MNVFLRCSMASLVLAAGILSAVPADARNDCASNASLERVDLRLDAAVDQLARDPNDYGGHKGQAMGDLRNARTELAAAREWAVAADHENGACFAAPARDEHVGYADLTRVRRRLETLIDQLQRDQHDYDGHRVRAIAQMQAARAQLVQAEEFRARR